MSCTQVNLLLLVFTVIFLLYPLGVSLPGVATSFLQLDLPTLPSLLQQYPDRPCSSCGLTRSVVAFYHGNLSASLNYNPAEPLIILVAVTQLLVRVFLIVYVTKNSWFSWLDIVQIFLFGLVIRFVLDVSLLRFI